MFVVMKKWENDGLIYENISGTDVGTRKEM